MVNSNIGDSSSSEDHRYIEVLLDVNAFSEGNLKILCAFVSKRFPAPNVLHMKVYTHLEDIETPEEQDRGVIFETSDDPSKDRYYRAFYLRDYYGNEWFSYNPNAPSRELKLVVLKGRGPYAQPK
ncbi:MAG: hypothetical protein KIT57_05075 [Blastocatellales bacterium]|nr:hypothetical protein [Blastocatellales bacterium]